MSLTSGRRALLAVVCAVAVGSVYAAQPALEQMGAIWLCPAASGAGSSRSGSSDTSSDSSRSYPSAI